MFLACVRTSENVAVIFTKKIWSEHIWISRSMDLNAQAWESGSKLRDRETAAKEIDKLRGTIQTLTRTTNPLGKLLDYVQVRCDDFV